MTLVSVTLTRPFIHRWWLLRTCEPSRKRASHRKLPNHGDEVGGRKRMLNFCRPAKNVRKSAKKGRTEFLLCIETTSDMRSLHSQTETDPWPCGVSDLCLPRSSRQGGVVPRRSPGDLRGRGGVRGLVELTDLGRDFGSHRRRSCPAHSGQSQANSSTVNNHVTNTGAWQHYEQPPENRHHGQGCWLQVQSTPNLCWICPRVSSTVWEVG